MRAVYIAAIALLLACGAAAQADCFANPTSATCASFVVEEATLKADLDSACVGPSSSSNSTGWPSACTLRAECAAGRATAEYCAPLRLARTACNEQPDLPFCSKYASLCGAQTKVTQCLGTAAIAEVPSASAAFSSAVDMCSKMDMKGCDTCSTAGTPGTVQAQALQVQCPNPLRSLSTICKDMWMPGCEQWDAFCQAAGNNTAFPALCDYRYAAPPPAAAPAAATAQAAVSSCYADPSAAQCASFRMPDADASSDLAKLCDDMPNMVGCTLRDECESNRAAGDLCAPFRLLGTVCTEMGSMKGCQRYTGLCTAPASVVQQCKEEGPVPRAPTTEEATDAVVAMCSDHAMTGCDQCTSRVACPHPLATLSTVCLEMPGMARCAPFFAMCQSAADTFEALCGQSGEAEGLPAMKMWLHAGIADIILIKAWVPRSIGAYVASCLVVVVLGIVVQALKAARVMTEARWAAEYRAVCCGPRCGQDKQSDSLSDLGAPSNELSGPSRPSMARLGAPLHGQLPSAAQVRRNVVRCAFTVVVVFLDYMLMLIVMTFNIGLVLCAVVGFGLGALAFGHLGERPGGVGALAAGEVAPDSENDLEVHFVDPQPCCNAHRV